MSVARFHLHVGGSLAYRRCLVSHTTRLDISRARACFAVCFSKQIRRKPDFNPTGPITLLAIEEDIERLEQSRKGTAIECGGQGRFRARSSALKHTSAPDSPVVRPGGCSRRAKRALLAIVTVCTFVSGFSNPLQSTIGDRAILDCSVSF